MCALAHTHTHTHAQTHTHTHTRTHAHTHTHTYTHAHMITTKLSSFLQFPLEELRQLLQQVHKMVWSGRTKSSQSKSDGRKTPSTGTRYVGVCVSDCVCVCLYV